MITYNPNISKDDLAALEAEVFPGKIHLITSRQDAVWACDYLKKQPVIGFDTETRPSFEKGEHHKMALVQLSDSSHCFLFQVSQMGMPRCLVKLLMNAKVKKIALSLFCDVKAIKGVCSFFRPYNFVELQNFVRPFGIQEQGLSKIYALIFGKRISKAQRLTDWERNPLTNAQQMYAALDAYATLRIFLQLEQDRANGYPLLPAPKGKDSIVNATLSNEGKAKKIKFTPCSQRPRKRHKAAGSSSSTTVAGSAASASGGVSGSKTVAGGGKRNIS